MAAKYRALDLNWLGHRSAIILTVDDTVYAEVLGMIVQLPITRRKINYLQVHLLGNVASNRLGLESSVKAALACESTQGDDPQPHLSHRPRSNRHNSIHVSIK